VQQHDLSAKINMTKLIQKHLAILAISGSGKSYCTAILLEELASRDVKDGRISVVVIDNHGEYADLDKDPIFQNKIITIDAKDIKIRTANISEKMFASLLPSMSSVQVRELGKIIKNTRKKSKGYDVKELIQEIKNNDDISKATREALVGWLSELEFMGLFSTSDWPNLKNFMKQGNIIVLNLKDILSLKKKQLIVNYISRMLFNLRKQGLIPPYLQIIEEAHNFCPEGRAAEHAISRSIIELLAREGRKFYANICLISQRPIQLSTTALSQCNSQIILKITNPYDLDHIGKSSEAISSHTLDIVSSLKVGEALIIGEAVNYPVFLKIRKRKSTETHGTKLEDYAILYEKLAKETGLADASEFL
jgi:DNA helicase HerA-like ATPase